MKLMIASAVIIAVSACSPVVAAPRTPIGITVFNPQPIDIGGYPADRCYTDTAASMLCHQNGSRSGTDSGGGGSGN